MKQVNLMHILLVGPLLLYIGIKKEKTPNFLFYSLGGIVSLLPFIVRIPGDNKISYRSIINMKHILLWLPLFGYISYKGQKLTENWWKIIIMLGLTIIVIHLYLYLNKLGIL